MEYIRKGVSTDFQFPLWDTISLGMGLASGSLIFQFPLWDTKIDSERQIEVYRNFQFPLWDTLQYGKDLDAIIKYLFQFPLWDTYCSLA